MTALTSLSDGTRRDAERNMVWLVPDPDVRHELMQMMGLIATPPPEGVCPRCLAPLPPERTGCRRAWCRRQGPLPQEDDDE